MKILPVCPYSFGANTYLLSSGESAMVIDPAVSVDALAAVLRENSATLTGVLLTHGHYDHTISIDTIRNEYLVDAYVHTDDAIMLTDGKLNAFYDFFGKECVHRAAEKLISDGDVICLGSESVRVIHTPGHTRGSVCFLGDDFLITGDTLFAQSIGRCDLWGGDEAQMRESLSLLRTFDPNLSIYPGHGEPSTLGSSLDNAAYYI